MSYSWCPQQGTFQYNIVASRPKNKARLYFLGQTNLLQPKDALIAYGTYG